MRHYGRDYGGQGWEGHRGSRGRFESRPRFDQAERERGYDSLYGGRFGGFGNESMSRGGSPGGHRSGGGGAFRGMDQEGGFARGGGWRGGGAGEGRTGWGHDRADFGGGRSRSGYGRGGTEFYRSRGEEYGRDFGDRIRHGWNRLRENVRDMMGGEGYDRGW